MTRIAIDLRMFRHSGIGRYLRNLIPALLPLLQADHIRLIANPGLLGEPVWLTGPHPDPRLEVFLTPAAVYSPAEQLLGLRGAFRDTDLLWVPHFNAPLWYSGRLAVTIHDVAYIALPEILPNPAKRFYSRLLIQRAVAQASAILCDSAFTAAELQRLCHADPARLTVAHLGLDEQWPTSATPHREPDALPYLLFVGNVKPNKNLSLLLTAFAQVRDRLPHRLVLAGQMRGMGTDDERVLHQAESFGDRVRFAGQIPDSELIALYAGASALVMPSLYEGFGLPLLEAMQMSCPILSSDAASLPEVAGDAALYFDPHDPASLAACLLRVRDEPLMQSLRSAGRARSARFSYASCAAQTAEVLNRLLERPS
jgi:glycosyltransferase involved in cell wall biosynthesis